MEEDEDEGGEGVAGDKERRKKRKKQKKGKRLRLVPDPGDLEVLEGHGVRVSAGVGPGVW